MSFFHTIWGPLGSFLCILYWGPQITFFAYYMGPLRSVSSHTIWGPLSDQFYCLLYGPPPLRSVSLHAIGGPHPILVFSQNIWGAPQISFSAYCMGPPQVSFFAYYMGSHQISFCAYFLGAPLRSVFSLTIWGPFRSVSSPPLKIGGPHIFEFARGGKCPLLPPLWAPMLQNIHLLKFLRLL